MLDGFFCCCQCRFSCVSDSGCSQKRCDRNLVEMLTVFLFPFPARSGLSNGSGRVICTSFKFFQTPGIPHRIYFQRMAELSEAGFTSYSVLKVQEISNLRAIGSPDQEGEYVRKVNCVVLKWFGLIRVGSLMKDQSLNSRSRSADYVLSQQVVSQKSWFHLTGFILDSLVLGRMRAEAIPSKLTVPMTQ